MTTDDGYLAMNLTPEIFLNLAAGLALCFAADGPLLAGTAPTSSKVKFPCPEFAAWQQNHEHPMPGTLRVIPNQHVTNKALEIQLIDMANAEQAAISAFNGRPPNPENKARWAKLQSIQKNNLAAIKSIVDKEGFPTITKVGKSGAWAALDLVQHADVDHSFQQHVLTLIKPLFKRGEVPGEAYAYLVDRVHVGQGLKQVYGTQVHLVNNELVMRPVEDAASLDARRKQAEMPSETAYLCYVSFRSGKKTRM